MDPSEHDEHEFDEHPATRRGAPSSPGARRLRSGLVLPSAGDAVEGEVVAQLGGLDMSDEHSLGSEEVLDPLQSAGVAPAVSSPAGKRPGGSTPDLHRHPGGGDLDLDQVKLELQAQVRAEVREAVQAGMAELLQAWQPAARESPGDRTNVPQGGVRAFTPGAPPWGGSPPALV